MKKISKYAIAFAAVVALGGSATLAMADTPANATTNSTTAQNTQTPQQKGNHPFAKGHGGFELQNNTDLQTLLKLSA
ncbi:hypothetical protein, partial [Tumebacillus flagellatus]|uniref:hypothetical protein n=1 Tax=Tumebacillus flagellatus TaxID=1157490 RepID=UPI0005710B5C